MANHHIAILWEFVDDLGEQNSMQDIERWVRGFGRHQGIPATDVQEFLVTLATAALL